MYEVAETSHVSNRLTDEHVLVADERDSYDLHVSCGRISATISSWKRGGLRCLAIVD